MPRAHARGFGYALSYLEHMVRTQPGAADSHLIRIIAVSGLKLSPYQLERWRTAGLVPRRSDTQVTIGGSTVHAPQTVALVAGLLVCAPRCRTNDDLALLAWFNQVPVPLDPVRAALLKAYFPHYSKARERENEALQQIPAEHRGQEGPWYDWAEAAASVDMDNRSAVQQMRTNLQRRRDLATASRTELDGRVCGVLTWLNAPALPTHDSVFMADLRSAMAFDGPPEQSRAAWLLAAHCHSEQLADRSETSRVERLSTFLAVTDKELCFLREQVCESLDAVGRMASEGRLSHVEVESAGMARMAGRMLVEWTTARRAHPPGSRPAQVLVDSLRSLWSLCSTDSVGEGRAAFQRRTPGG
ncbi:hypothetical protein GCM10023323_66820 [Streptomyces thinghirensis]|uniref:Thiopeptide-type bacteriocin biosynthesis domain-containing protein n=2 Tax=Streptomyces thinghirensis TaxID=551547 RepID=A0ABP9TG23_9ACTN